VFGHTSAISKAQTQQCVISGFCHYSLRNNSEERIFQTEQVKSTVESTSNFCFDCSFDKYFSSLPLLHQNHMD